MLSSDTYWALFLVMLIALVVMWAVFLRIGLRWTRIPDVTTLRLCLATAVVVTVRGALIAAVLVIPHDWNPSLIVSLTLPVLATGPVVSCLVIARVFRTQFSRAFRAWLPTLLAPAALFLFVMTTLTPLICESFYVPTNAMAPTLLGNHQRGTCPTCGAPNYRTPLDEHPGLRRSPEEESMICDNFHVVEGGEVEPRVYSGDRVMVARFLAPRRWDLVVFRAPEEPNQVLVKRLVGLPGEEIVIRDGSAWADGRKLSPPGRLEGLEYTDGPWDEAWGSEELPARLGEDEYFVLGDFSPRSRDSCWWEIGAPGHPPYAVPRSHMIGVVTNIYWPPTRMRVLR